MSILGSGVHLMKITPALVIFRHDIDENIRLQKYGQYVSNTFQIFYRKLTFHYEHFGKSK